MRPAKLANSAVRERGQNRHAVVALGIQIEVREIVVRESLPFLGAPLRSLLLTYVGTTFGIPETRLNGKHEFDLFARAAVRDEAFHLLSLTLIGALLPHVLFLGTTARAGTESYRRRRG